MRALLAGTAAALLAAAASGCASARGYAGRTPLDPRTRIPPGVRAEWTHFTDSTVGPGEVAPDFTLPTADGRSSLSLSTFRGMPLVLVFGSYT